MFITHVYKEYTSRHADSYGANNNVVVEIRYNESENYVDVTFITGKIRRIFKPDAIGF